VDPSNLTDPPVRENPGESVHPVPAVLRLVPRSIPPPRAGAFPAGHVEDPGHQSPRPVRHRDAYLHPTAFL